jgi:hypothetical protein
LSPRSSRSSAWTRQTDLKVIGSYSTEKEARTEENLPVGGISIFLTLS